jgi:hypothetical protein
MTIESSSSLNLRDCYSFFDLGHDTLKYADSAIDYIFYIRSYASRGYAPPGSGQRMLYLESFFLPVQKVSFCSQGLYWV